MKRVAEDYGHIGQAKADLAAYGEPAMESCANPAGVRVEVLAQLPRTTCLSPGVILAPQVQLHGLPVDVLAVFEGGVGEVLFDAKVQGCGDTHLDSV